MAENKTPRITKAQRYADIQALLMGEPVQHDTTVEIAVEFVANEIEMLARKNTSTTKKNDEAKKRNLELEELIVKYLAGLEDNKDGKTYSEIKKAIPEFEDAETQKIAYLVNQLVSMERAVTKEVKGRKRVWLVTETNTETE